MSDRWDQLQALFETALPLEGEALAIFLDERCAGDPSLRRELEALLLAARSENAALTDLIGAAARSAAAEPSDSSDQLAPGTPVGSYRVDAHLGAGGMGDVYLASRADGSYEKQVALKVIRRGMDSAAIVARFERERQLLAGLSHPGIAALLDGGVTGDGRPFFAMEYVDGERIDRYCDRHRLSLTARVELFVQVCQVVHYAHQNLIVHRDLKPSNVLVTAEGQVKLLDFGIAKSLESDDEDLTQPGLVPFTPGFAAPEQLLGETVSTATDVYTLGVLLYLLLAGRRPFEAQKSAATLEAEILRGDPPRPSTAVTTLAEAAQRDATTVATDRGLRLEALRRALRGDLDTICLTALARDPAARFGSAAAFASDLDLFLRHEPIRARPPVLGYRLRKFARRHRVGLAATVAIAGSLAIVGSYATARIAAERDRAVAERATTEQVVAFLVSLFEGSDPGQARGETVTAQQLLESAMRRIDSELKGQPAIRQRLLSVLAEVNSALGQDEQARALYREAFKLLESTRTPADDERSEFRAELELGAGVIEQNLGELDAAETHFRQALRLAKASGSLLLEQRSLGALAFLEETRGEPAKADALFVKALAIARRRASGVDDHWLAMALKERSGILRMQDRPRDAEPLLKEALAMFERLYGSPHPEAADVKRMLAGVYRDTERYDIARPLYLEMIDERTRMLGESHREVLHSWNSYTHLLSKEKDYEEVQVVQDRVMAELERQSEASGQLHVSLPVM